MSKEKIGFIGMGIMGKPMAKNLIKAGYKLTVFDINKEAVDEIVKIGGIVKNSPREVAESNKIIITMLPNSPEVLDVTLGKNGIIEGAIKGSVVIDMSSIEPLVSKEIAGKFQDIEVDCLDAPVSGGEPKAIDGTLAIMVGGSEEAFNRCKPILEKMGKSITRVGDSGGGQTVKLVNQIVVALNIAAVSEAFVLGKKCGVNPVNIFEAIRGGLAGSTVMDAKIPMILDRNFKPGFKIDLHIKDLENVLKTSRKLNTPLPLTGLVMEIFQALKVENLGQEDHSAIVKFFEKISNLELRE